jgi:hypothetical protein
MDSGDSKGNYTLKIYYTDGYLCEISGIDEDTCFAALKFFTKQVLFVFNLQDATHAINMKYVRNIEYREAT